MKRFAQNHTAHKWQCMDLKQAEVACFVQSHMGFMNLASSGRQVKTMQGGGVSEIDRP